MNKFHEILANPPRTVYDAIQLPDLCEVLMSEGRYAGKAKALWETIFHSTSVQGQQYIDFKDTLVCFMLAMSDEDLWEVFGIGEQP